MLLVIGQVPPQSGPTYRSYARLMAIAGLVVLVGSGLAFSIHPGRAFQVGAGLGAVLLLGAILLWSGTIHLVLAGRSVKYGPRATVMSLAFISILGLVNFLSLKYNYEYDLTENGRFSLSKQTIRVLASMREPVQVIGFFRTDDHRLKLAQDYLERYSCYTDQLSYEFHDPGVEPALAQSYKLGRYGLVFVSGVKRYETSTIDEQTITSSLIRVTSKKPGNELVFIRPKKPTNRQLFLTPLQTGLTFFTTLIVVPVVIFAAGLGVWWMRR
jgi:ABC-type uncharacterized transport system involved in gliding motility auxiliary subunit